MRYCPEYDNFHAVWHESGLSVCFLETVSNAVGCAYMVGFGLVQITLHALSAGLVRENLVHKSKSLFRLQLALIALIPLLGVLHLVLRSTVLEGGVQGYVVLAMALNIMSWMMTVPLIGIETRNSRDDLHRRQRTGHSALLLTFWSWMAIKENLYFLTTASEHSWFALKSISDKAELAIFCFRYVATLLVLALGFYAPGISQPKIHPTDSQRTQEMLLTNRTESRRSITRSPWNNLGAKVKILSPFIWPKKETWLQLRVVGYFLCVAAERVVNLFVPIYSKKIVDSISGDENNTPIRFRWDLVVSYVGLRLVQGGVARSGILGNIRSFLWIRVQQYTEREVQVKFFSHLHSLSVRWHLQRKTGEVLRAVDRGTESINTLLNYVLFNILPSIADFVIAVVYFSAAFNAWFGVIVVLTIVIFVVATIYLTEWRTKFRRKMNQADNEQQAQAVDSLLNFETVKYYAQEKNEVKHYNDVIRKYQAEEWKLNVAIILFNVAQNVIINSGLLAGSLLCVSMVVDRELTLGDYVLFVAYINQLYAPLASFGSYYRTLQKNLIDMENLFELFKKEPEVKDKDDAPELHVLQGKIEFQDVSFGYTPEHETLSRVSFVANPGATIALVGPSGSGKSTILRLLFRFYDVWEGCILIDGQDIRDVTQESLRKSLGIVPQDTVLYNNSIRYNILYGRNDATEGDVIEAAKRAEIHDTIASLEDGYNTQVGERGLKLSGGEKQRVAIARTLIKSPAFVLLDEATSALDSHTERNIQETLEKVLQNCTTIVIAHRLSTVVHADEILVLRDGIIIERGNHEALLKRRGFYTSMWEEQTKRSEHGNIT